MFFLNSIEKKIKTSKYFNNTYRTTHYLNSQLNFLIAFHHFFFVFSHKAPCFSCHQPGILLLYPHNTSFTCPSGLWPWLKNILIYLLTIMYCLMDLIKKHLYCIVLYWIKIILVLIAYACINKHTPICNFHNTKIQKKLKEKY